jgi:hypothetical protein
LQHVKILPEACTEDPLLRDDCHSPQWRIPSRKFNKPSHIVALHK